MIQKTSARHIQSAPTDSARLPQPQQGSQQHHLHKVDAQDSWGVWLNSRHYSLDIMQHPLRARMCGFGDKDRRPLAPAAVAKMIVRAEDNSLVDVDDVDYAFFVVCVDLWSSDGKREMNLVLHPSSADRYIPTPVSKPRRRPAPIPPPRQAASPAPQQTQIPTTFPLRPVDQPSMPPPQPGPGYPGYGFSDPFPFGHPGPYASAWPYPAPGAPGTSAPPPQYPREVWQQGSVRPDTDVSPYRAWGNDAQALDGGQSSTSTPTEQVPRAGPGEHPPDGSREAAEPVGWPATTNVQGPPGVDGHPGQMHAPVGPPTREQYDTRFTTTMASTMAPVENTIYTHVPYSPTAQAYPQQEHSSSSQQSTTAPAMPRHTYTRTLVGPLSANATRLLDEHRKPGIFFLFQDLSIRTEGTFRLRLRLMNVGAPPAPDPGALRVHTDVSPVLAQTFTEQFVVYSAKRFPGVPDTTALSIAFGNQGQKLPLRNRHGSSKQRGRRRRGAEESSDSDSE